MPLELYSCFLDLNLSQTVQGYAYLCIIFWYYYHLSNHIVGFIVTKFGVATNRV